MLTVERASRPRAARLGEPLALARVGQRRRRPAGAPPRPRESPAAGPHHHRHRDRTSVLVVRLPGRRGGDVRPAADRHVGGHPGRARVALVAGSWSTLRGARGRPLGDRGSPSTRPGEYVLRALAHDGGLQTYEDVHRDGEPRSRSPPPPRVCTGTGAAPDASPVAVRRPHRLRPRGSGIGTGRASRRRRRGDGAVARRRAAASGSGFRTVERCRVRPIGWAETGSARRGILRPGVLRGSFPMLTRRFVQALTVPPAGAGRRRRPVARRERPAPRGPSLRRGRLLASIPASGDLREGHRAHPAAELPVVPPARRGRPDVAGDLRGGPAVGRGRIQAQDRHPRPAGGPMPPFFVERRTSGILRVQGRSVAERRGAREDSRPGPTTAPPAGIPPTCLRPSSSRRRGRVDPGRAGPRAALARGDAPRRRPRLVGATSGWCRAGSPRTVT